MTALCVLGLAIAIPVFRVALDSAVEDPAGLHQTCGGEHRSPVPGFRLAGTHKPQLPPAQPNRDSGQFGQTLPIMCFGFPQ